MYIIGGERVRSRRKRAGCRPRFPNWESRKIKRKGSGSSVVIKVKIPALSLQKPERQGQSTLVSKIREKGWASPPFCVLQSVPRSQFTKGDSCHAVRDSRSHIWDLEELLQSA